MTHKRWGLVLGGLFAVYVAIVLGNHYFAIGFGRQVLGPDGAWSSGDGAKYCSDLAGRTQQLGYLINWVGTLVALLGSALLILGNILPEGEQDAAFVKKHRTKLLLNLGSILMGLSFYAFDRGEAATLAGLKATRAIRDLGSESSPSQLTDRGAWEQCVESYAQWRESRIESAKLIQGQLKEVTEQSKPQGSREQN